MFDYSAITKIDLENDIKNTLKVGLEQIQKIKNEDTPSLDLFDLFERTLSDLSGRVAFMADVSKEKDIRDYSNKAESIIENFLLEVTTDIELYEKFKSIKTNTLDKESVKYFNEVIRDFIDAGHELDHDKKTRLIEIEKKLIDLEIDFSKNIAADKSEVILSKSQLKGLSTDEMNNFRKEEENFIVTMAYPDINAVLENCQIRDSREKVWKAFNNRAVLENSPILKEAVALRNEKATLFGFNTWAEYRLQYRMAKSPENVVKMYDNLVPKLQKAAQNEKVELATDNIEPSDIAPWDIRYFITKKRNKQSQVDNNEIKKYFYIHNVKEAMFSICEDVFEISINQEDSRTAWHEDVELWSISDQNNKKMAYFYLDMYPREGKYTHAAVFDISPGSADEMNLPVCSMVANFPNPNTGNGLMTFDEVETLFHEFGHVLHNGIGKSKFARFLGANVEWDFVEAPSQIMEHWVWKSECLKRFSKHIDTGETLDHDLCVRLNSSKNIGISLLTLRQISFGLADQHLHGINFNDSLDEIEQESQIVTTINYPNDTNHLGAFGHLLGGYDAAYYGYLWADIIGDDLFSRFEDEGVLSKEVGIEYKTKILSVGGSKGAEEMVEDFLGRKWNDEAFLNQKKLGNF
ncbi:Zn-dependent oligopeptidase [Acidimicrobiia bacterium]|nr:Zn-dependent oligopeptidase [Acidimicrobiia bacterium]